MRRAVLGVSAGAALAMAVCAGGCASKVMTGLCAVDPAAPDKVLRGEVVVRGPERVLRWQVFPRPQDEAALGPGGAGRVSNVRYELKIWALPWSSDVGAGGGSGAAAAPPMVITGLRAPEYRLKELVAGARYWWAVRARFDFEGRPRVTQWTTEGQAAPLWDGTGGHPMLRVEDAPAVSGR